MIKTFLICVLGIVGMMLLWILVQTGWRRMFYDNITDDDVLAERRSCSNCGCTTICENKKLELSKNQA